MTLKLEFVELMPQQLQDGVLYVSMEYATAIHLCACGCGRKVVTPFSPKDWCLTYNGEELSLSPSIGNWNFPCRSHYWIIRNHIRWANAWHDDYDSARIQNKLPANKLNKKKQKRYWLWDKLFGTWL